MLTLRVIKQEFNSSSSSSSNNNNNNNKHKYKRDARSNWNHLKIIQKILEQHTGKARNQGTTENSHTGRCTHTLESTNVKEQNIQRGK
jgi:ribosomal protein L14E/L6E/L27E